MANNVDYNLLTDLKIASASFEYLLNEQCKRDNQRYRQCEVPNLNFLTDILHSEERYSLAEITFEKWNSMIREDICTLASLKVLSERVQDKEDLSSTLGTNRTSDGPQGVIQDIARRHHSQLNSVNLQTYYFQLKQTTSLLEMLQKPSQPAEKYDTLCDVASHGFQIPQFLPEAASKEFSNALEHSNHREKILITSNDNVKEVNKASKQVDPINANSNKSKFKGISISNETLSAKLGNTGFIKPGKKNTGQKEKPDITELDELKHFENKIRDTILNEVMVASPKVSWKDIIGLDFVKSTLSEMVSWPLLRPELFTGLREPARGILLFGPPGTGKTLLGKCVATQAQSTFFCISASSFASKYIGESEQLVRALFTIARHKQPSIIFIDEIDSLLSKRSEAEENSARKVKTEFFVQFDGLKSNSLDKVLVIGATNRPHELDDAARRRFAKQIYCPLPDKEARFKIIEHLLSANSHEVSEKDLKKLSDLTEGYSGSDVTNLCKEAAMGPIRDMDPQKISTIRANEVRGINFKDFSNALRQVRASVDPDTIKYYEDWDKQFGSR